MKCILLISLVVFSAQEVLLFAPPPRECFSNMCPQEFEPVCGKQKIGDCWDFQIFNNSCLMKAANHCGPENYVPCVENTCPPHVEFELP